VCQLFGNGAESYCSIAQVTKTKAKCKCEKRKVGVQLSRFGHIIEVDFVFIAKLILSMKKTFLIALFGIPLLVNAQRTSETNDIPLNYTLLTERSFSYAQSMVFDSTLLAKAGIKKAEISIKDSLTASSAKANTYSESMSFEFMKNGRIKLAGYSIKHPKMKETRSMYYSYLPGNKIFYKEGSDGMSYASLTSYSPSGEAVNEKTWLYLGITGNKPIKDTTQKESTKYSCFTKSKLVVTENCASFSSGEDFKCNTVTTTFSRKSGDTTFYSNRAEYKTWYGNDTVVVYTSMEIRDRNGKITGTARVYDHEIVWTNIYRYDNAGYLIYYQTKEYGYYSYEITRGADELPTQIIYRNLMPDRKRSVAFDFKYSQ
jgi:hypothetical protein